MLQYWTGAIRKLGDLSVLAGGQMNLNAGIRDYLQHATGPGLAAGSSVLIVDDERGVLRMLEKTILRMELDARSAQDGDEALRLVSQPGQKFVLAIIDLNIPGLAGASLIRELRRQSPGISILMMSGDDQVCHDPELAACDVDGVLVKPFDLDEIRRRIRRLLDPVSVH